MNSNVYNRFNILAKKDSQNGGDPRLKGYEVHYKQGVFSKFIDPDDARNYAYFNRKRELEIEDSRRSKTVNKHVLDEATQKIKDELIKKGSQLLFTENIREKVQGVLDADFSEDEIYDSSDPSLLQDVQDIIDEHEYDDIEVESQPIYPEAAHKYNINIGDSIESILQFDADRKFNVVKLARDILSKIKFFDQRIQDKLDRDKTFDKDRLFNYFLEEFDAKIKFKQDYDPGFIDNFGDYYVVFLNSGGGKTTLKEKFPSYFFDIDDLLKIYGYTTYIAQLSTDAQKNSDWTAVNNFWKYLVYRSRSLFRGRILLAHSPDQIPSCLMQQHAPLVLISTKTRKKISKLNKDHLLSLNGYVKVISTYRGYQDLILCHFRMYRKKYLVNFISQYAENLVRNYSAFILYLKSCMQFIN